MKFRDGGSPGAMQAMRAGGARVDRWLPGEDTAVVRVMGSTGRAVAALNSDPRVEWAEPNYRVRGLAVPNDQLFDQQWALANIGQSIDGVAGLAGADIGVARAWDRSTGGDNVSVAIVDGGVDYTHPDLAPNMTLRNPGESGGGRETNRIDDDGNGLVDDWRGWDWVSDDNDPMDLGVVSHGTRVAGIIGARGNDGFGISGTAWRARMMSLRVLDASGGGTIADVAASFHYAGQLNIRIVNASLGSPGLTSRALSDSIAAHPDTLFVFAAGNDGTDNDGGGGHVFPCDLPQENILCVGASDQNDARAAFSNTGAVSIDLSAPGENITSTTRSGGYSTDDGTSFAAPFAAGVAGLVLATNPGARTSQLKGALLAGATPTAGLAGASATGARLSADGALAAVPGVDPARAPVAGTNRPRRILTRSATLAGTVVPNGGPASYWFEYGRTRRYGQRTVLYPGVTGRGPVRAEILRLRPNTRYHYRLMVVDYDGKSAGPNRTLRTVGRRARLAVRLEGRRARAVADLPARTRISGRLLRRSVVMRSGAAPGGVPAGLTRPVPGAGRGRRAHRRPRQARSGPLPAAGAARLANGAAQPGPQLPGEPPTATHRAGGARRPQALRRRPAAFAGADLGCRRARARSALRPGGARPTAGGRSRRAARAAAGRICARTVPSDAGAERGRAHHATRSALRLLVAGEQGGDLLLAPFHDPAEGVDGHRPEL